MCFAYIIYQSHNFLNKLSFLLPNKYEQDERGYEGIVDMDEDMRVNDECDTIDVKLEGEGEGVYKNKN